MYDRIPSPGKENRVRITQDNGQIVEGVLSYADDATQEGSAYTKGNVLPDAVLSLIGLPTESSEPANMFNVLATAGDLHVWRRTVTSGGQEAGYTLGAVSELTFSGAGTRVYTADSISVSNDGSLTPFGTNSYSMSDAAGSASPLLGKFVYEDGNPPYYFVPSDSSVTFRTTPYNAYLDISKAKLVTGYPAVPPDTITVDYPVSVNPNAYQTGSDAQPAGYTLGDVQSGQFNLSLAAPPYEITYRYGSSVTVKDDGTVELVYEGSAGVTISSYATPLRGKFFVCTGSSDAYFQKGVIYFMPLDAEFTDFSGYCAVDKYQTVTGYPATPAGTTIEYLGKLGDKSRAQIVSYVGTGTYGSGNKTTISFSSSPSVVFVFQTGGGPTTSPYSNGWENMAIFCKGMRLIRINGNKSEFSVFGSVLTITSTANAASQLNQNGVKYLAMALLM